MKFTSTLKLKLIYIFRINDKTHAGCLKIGEATSDSDVITGLSINSAELNNAAHKRIRQYTQTAGIKYELLHTELCVFTKKGSLFSFSDSEVHKVLERSGIKKKIFDEKNKTNEWFITDLETAQKAIEAVKDGRESLHPGQISTGKSPIVFREEQRQAIDKTIKQFKHSDVMLWNAKMRFGKTLSALQLVQEMNFKRTLILTHRPVVDAGWFEDFGKIFKDNNNFKYGSKTNGDRFKTLESACINSKENKKYVYFASMQDLRGSIVAGGGFDKNNDIFQTRWDLVIIDEAHEGTNTELGKNVISELRKHRPKLLKLSGTPYNLLDEHKENEIFTWDYVMEQKAKKDWDALHFGDSNPYASLPRLNIYTYDLGKLMKEFIDEDVAFNFKEFFRVNSEGKFLHEEDVASFLNLITKKSEQSNYPYSTEEYRENFRHSLWMVPGVKEAKALSTMLKKHPVFSQFKIANVAGEGDEEESNEEAFKKVKSAIGEKPHENYSITLSCGRLTTGVSVPAWTAVFMLSGSSYTSASGYMQTIFRVQTPATINGRIKEECYVFDFAPDRTLKVIAETAKMSAKAGKTNGNDRENMGEFLNFCPIIAVDGSKMKAFNVDGMLEQLKKVYIERVVKNGFEDGYLYNNDELMKLSNLELSEFDKLKKIIGTTAAMPKTNDIDINNLGFTNEQYEQMENAQKNKKKKIELTENEQRLLEEKMKKKKNRDAAVSILRGISIRMPLLIYGADVNNEDKEINIENFTNLIDDKSWEEFMPNGISKEHFNTFKKYYEPDIFRAAGKRIRAMARAADNLNIEERINRITTIFSTFRNPDKETVLTPWRVVNMHLGDCLGGYIFYNEKYDNTIEKPRFIENNNITKNVFSTDSKILEINSKSGLYPLYIAYNIYRSRIKLIRSSQFTNILTLAEQQKIWDKVITENIFVICKTPMAISITKRTLIGFRNAKVNSKHFEDLVNEITINANNFIKTVKQGKTFWQSNNNNDMKFNAIVGNPPYQVMDGGNSASAKPVYNLFVEIAKQINPQFISMIMPARWYAGGKGLDGFRESMLNDSRIVSLFDFANSNDCFTNVDIAGGLCYFLWDKNFNGECLVSNYIKGVYYSEKRKLNEFEIFVRESKSISIIRKINTYNTSKKFLNNIVSVSKPFGIRGNHKPSKSGIPCYFTQKQGKLFVKTKELTDNYNLLNKYKLLVPRAPIAGQTDFTKPVGFYYDGNTRIALPGECCTETYIVAGAFDSEKEVKSYKSYIFTKTVRFLLLQTVVSQDVTKKNFSFIPDLGKYEGQYTDEQLCELWNITKEEWEYIDSRITSI